MLKPSTPELISAAMAAQAQAYAPYSGYRVGAAILDENNQIHTGCNVENISFGATICAERSAVSKMITTGSRQIRQIVVVTPDGGTPCGLCRQVMIEFAPDPAMIPVFIVRQDEPETYNAMTLADLVPFAFQSKQVSRTESDKRVV